MDADELRALFQQAILRTRTALTSLLAQVQRLAAPLLAAWARFTIERWERMRAFVAGHPDLAEFDAWLDRWYSFGTA